MEFGAHQNEGRDCQRGVHFQQDQPQDEAPRNDVQNQPGGEPPPVVVQDQPRGQQRQPGVRKVPGAAKAPKFDDDGGFDLYKARLESYLRQRDCWNVVIGTEGPDTENEEANQIFEERNLFARDALLHGLLSKDAKKICKMSRVSEMWTSFEQDKTKRDFANSIRIRAKLYGARFERGKNMDKYLEELEDYRRQLENMNNVITDEDMASIILTGVEGTHRSVVRMFNRDDNPPTLTQVLNSLRGEAEMDKAEEERNTKVENYEDERKKIGSMKKSKGKKPWKTKKHKKISGDKKVSETRECWYCKIPGHLRANCKAWKADQNKPKRKDSDSDDDSAAGIKSTKSSKTKSNGVGYVGRWTKRPGTIGMVHCSSGEDGLQSMACFSNGFEQTWMLDTGTDVHVCTDLSAFRDGIQEDTEYFDNWQGDRATSDGIGLVQVETINAVGSERKRVLLELRDTRYSSGGHTNLVSQERLEQDGWEPSTPPAPTPEDRVTYFTNAFYPDVKLVFKKRHGHYWLDATPVHGENAICAMTSSGTTDKVLMWHMKLGHLNIQAIKKMVEMDMVEGMEELTLTDFKKPFRCIACQRAKQKRMSYKRHQKRQKECYARLMSDVCNVGIVTPGGNIYFQLIQDEASRYKWVFLLETKDQAADNVMDLILKLEKENSIKIFSCDQGKEFVNKKLSTFLNEHQIELLTTNAYTPEENCLVEKLNGGLMSKVRAINEAALLPECLWGEVIGR